MAEVWLARQSGLHGFEKMVVIKRMIGALEDEPEFVEMFLREARLAAQLSHPNVVQVFELGEISGSLFIVMEYLDGESLVGVRRYGHASGRHLSNELTAFVCAQVAAGLHYAHTMVGRDGKPLGIVHRDVSPQNIIVTGEGGVKLVDFGIAKAATHATASERLKGKISYMSPEQGRSEPVDLRSDIFSLGVVLFEQLTRTRLYVRQSDLTVLRQVVSDEPLPAPSSVRGDIPDALDDIVVKATARNRDHRFQTARELQLALEAWLVSSVGPASSSELATWVRDAFADRMARRRALIAASTRGEYQPVLTSPLAELTLTPSDGSLGNLSDSQPRRRASRVVQLVSTAVAIAAGGTTLWLALTAPSDVATKAPPAATARPPATTRPPATALPALPATASLSVETEPAGAQVLIDGTARGASPLQLDGLPVGEHRVSGHLDGYQSAERTLTLDAASRSMVLLTLTREHPGTAPVRHATGRLNLSSKPWVSVYFGAVKLGDTPLVNVTLPAGKHLLRLINPEQQIDQSIAVDIAANATTTKKLKL